MSVLKVEIQTGRANAWLTGMFETAGGKHAIINRLRQYLAQVLAGNSGPDGSTNPNVVFKIQANQTQASGTIAFSGVSTANDTVLINGVTFTAVASGATGNQWNVGANATASAANLAAAINASATALVSSQVSASAASGTLTITSLNYGVYGNQCTIAKGVDAGSVMTVSGARLTGGADDASKLTLNF